MLIPCTLCFILCLLQINLFLARIEALTSYRDKWNEISDVYEKQQDKLLAAEIMGSQWECDVLNGRLDTLRSFTEQYIALQHSLHALLHTVPSPNQSVSGARHLLYLMHRFLPVRRRFLIFPALKYR